MPSFNSTYWPPPAWIVPVPSSRSTSASAKISFSSAHSAGIGTPCGSKWPFSRDTERPSAPACMPSRTTSCIALICVVGGARLLAVVAHHVMAHRGMADQIADIDAETLVEMVHVLRDRLPVEIDGAQHLHRDRFDIGEELGHPFLGALAHRRQRQRAIAEDHRGGAVLGRERAQRVPGHLRVVMAVVVDKAGGDGAAVGVDGASRPVPESLPISTILPFLMPTSPRNAGIPEPSTISPFLISRSYAIGFFLSAQTGPAVATRENSLAKCTPSGRAKQRRRGALRPESHVLSAGGPSTNARERPAVKMVRRAAFVVKPYPHPAAPARPSMECPRS